MFGILESCGEEDTCMGGEEDTCMGSCRGDEGGMERVGSMFE